MQIFDLTDTVEHDASFLFEDEDYIYVVSEHAYEHFAPLLKSYRMQDADIVIRKHDRKVVKARHF